MRSPFRSKARITQAFGARPEYYKQFKLAGHEGLDLVPTGSVWDILALEDGVVVLDDDVVGSVSADPYGKIVTIWHNKINKATMYCHLQENFVSQGQIVKKGDKIGTMGATGNVDGAHLHLNLFNTDASGIRLNRDNGYLGGIDPEPWLESLNDDATVPVDNTVELNKCLNERGIFSHDLDQIKNALLVVGDYSLTTVMARIDALLQTEKAVSDKEKANTELLNQLTELETRANTLKTENEQLTQKLDESDLNQKKMNDKIGQLLEEIRNLRQSAGTQTVTGWRRTLVDFLLKF